MSADSLTHLNARGEAHMVDVGDKAVTHRRAVADGVIRMQPSTLKMIEEASSEKGDVLAVARIAGIQAVKRTADLIPLCHPLPVTHVDVAFEIERSSVRCIVEVATDAKTGVEMEALTAVQVSLLTIYDMCKAVDRGMTMHDIGLVSKQGGRSGEWHREDKADS